MAANETAPRKLGARETPPRKPIRRPRREPSPSDPGVTRVRTYLLPPLLALACARAPLAPPRTPATTPAIVQPTPATTDAAWRELVTRLPGHWRAETPGGAIAIEYRLIANGSALLELFGTTSGGQTATLLHPDGAALRLTHYCGQRNQAHLVLTEADATHLTFTLDHVGNAGDGAVLVRAELRWTDAGVDMLETYRQRDDRESTDTLHLVRAPP